MKSMFCFSALLVAFLSGSEADPDAPVPAKPLELCGVSLSGAEFGKGQSPYPGAAEAKYFQNQGMNLIRLPFLWERLQNKLDAPFDADELNRLKKLVEEITAQGQSVIIDVHNYARYQGKIIGSPEVPVKSFACFWKQLATSFKDNPRVLFGLMNEPHTMKSETWLASANAAIAAIRETGAKQTVFLCGNGWSGAHSWSHKWYGTANAEAMLQIVDPADKVVFEVHQYLDPKGAGETPDCVGPQVGVEALSGFTAWLKQHKKRGFLGEFGGAVSPHSKEAIHAMLKHMEANPEVWVGWAWWGGGQSWPQSYLFRLSPDKQDQPAAQMAWLKPFLAKGGEDQQPHSQIEPRTQSRPLSSSQQLDSAP